jgi:two-component system sensor histidine kinase HydH
LTGRARRLEEQAEGAERMAYVGTLASGLAHEIRSPLNSLSLNMQLLEEEAREQSGTGGQMRLLALTRSELKRLERLATDFLTYARPRALEWTEIEVAKLLARVAELLQADLRARGIRLEIENRVGTALLAGDEGLLTQLLLNLANNAIAALEAKAEGGDFAKLLKIGAGRGDGALLLEVGDNGEGMSAEIKARIFELFFSNRKGGTGLGLAIVQRIAEAHGATIEVDSEPGQGTTMRVRFEPDNAINRGRRPPTRRNPPES